MEKRQNNLEDIHLAAALICNGCALESIHEVVPGRFAFVFQEMLDQDSLLEQYWQGEMRVEPKQFANAVRELKARTKIRKFYQ